MYMKPTPPSTPASKAFKVAIAIEMHYPYPWHIDMSQGIMRYGQEHGWTCVIDPYLLNFSTGKKMDFDGVIGRLSKDFHLAMAGHHVPAVNVMGSNFVTHLEDVTSLKEDMAQIMRMAAEHLIEQGYRKIGYIGVSRLTGNEQKASFLTELLESHDLAAPACILLPDDFDTNRETTLVICDQLSRWLEGLAKPVGLLVQNPIVATLLLTLCDQLSLRVPKDVGVVGLFSSEAVSLASSPTITYVHSDNYQHGYQAAALLDKLMAGQEVNPRQRYFAKYAVVVRESSDIFLCADPRVSEAVRYIAGQVRRNLGVDDVAGHLGVARRTLERYFTDTLGRSIQSEIKRLRIDYLKHLLIETKRPLSDIAADCGFSSTGYFAKYFKDEVGVTPSTYRKQNAGLPSA